MGGEPSVGETKGRSHRPVSRDRRRSEIGSAIHLLWVQRRDRTDAQTATALRKRYVISLSYLARPLALPFDERRVPIDKRLDDYPSCRRAPITKSKEKHIPNRSAESRGGEKLSSTVSAWG